jgi:hypothetical protein
MDALFGRVYPAALGRSASRPLPVSAMARAFAKA